MKSSKFLSSPGVFSLVETIWFFSEEDEDEDEELARKPEMKDDNGLDGEDDIPMRTEPTNDAKVKATKNRRSAESTELEVLSEEVLASLDLDELKGDVAALEGVWDICAGIFFRPFNTLHYY